MKKSLIELFMALLMSILLDYVIIEVLHYYGIHNTKLCYVIGAFVGILSMVIVSYCMSDKKDKSK